MSLEVDVHHGQPGLATLFMSKGPPLQAWGMKNCIPREAKVVRPHRKHGSMVTAGRKGGVGGGEEGMGV